MYELGHKILILIAHASSKGADQHVHMCSHAELFLLIHLKHYTKD